MELEQGDERAPDTGGLALKDEVSSSRGLVLYVMRLMGKTTWLAQRAGTETAKGIIARAAGLTGSAGGRGAGRLVKACRSGPRPDAHAPHSNCRVEDPTYPCQKEGHVSTSTGAAT